MCGRRSLTRLTIGCHRPCVRSLRLSVRRAGSAPQKLGRSSRMLLGPVRRFAVEQRDKLRPIDDLAVKMVSTVPLLHVTS